MSHAAFMPDAQTEALLALPDTGARLARLRATGWLNESGVSALLDYAEAAVRENPGRTRALAELCVAAATDLGGAQAMLPRAQYLLAQTHAIHAEFERALALIDAAHAGYTRSGQHAEALRTQVGRIAALRDLGRHSEAIEVAARALREARRINADTDLIARINLNLGACHTELGRPDDALTALAAAEEVYVANGSPLGAGGVSNNRGVLLLSLGRAREAQAAFEFAARQFAAGGEALESAHAIQNAGYAHMLLGEHSAGLAALQRASALLHALAASADQLVALLDLADSYLSLNLFPEALSAYREADALLSKAGMTRERARALWGLGASLAALSYFADAEQALRESAELFGAAGNLPALITVLLEQAALLAARGQRPQAVAAARDVLSRLATHDLPLQAAQAHLRLATWLAPAADAQAELAAAQALADRLALPNLRQQVLTESGHAALGAGQVALAEALLTEAVALAEQQRASLSQSRLRTAFLSNKARAYDGLVALHASAGADGAARAFDMSERAKSRTLIDQMNGWSRRPDANGDASQLQALIVRLNECYGTLLAGDHDGADGLADLQARALAIEQDISRIQLQSAVPADMTEGSAAALGEPLPLPSVAAALPAGAVLLSYYVLGEAVLVFVLTPGDPPRLRLARLGAVADVEQLLTRLDRQWSRFEHEAALTMRHQAQLERSARAVLASLYDALVRPIEPFIHGEDGAVRDVVIVPHGILHQAPFHAFHDGAQYWIDKACISYAPSATAMALCQQRQGAASGRSLVFGVADARIPAVNDEARQVARLLAQPEPRLGEAAARGRFLADAPGCDVIHLACHGLFRADNPMFSSLKLGDGWLNAGDVAALNLSGAQVTLSACESGRTQVTGGDEVLGLTHAFLGAGARTLIVSLWLAHDSTTARLMTAYYERLKTGAPPARALREAQLALKQDAPHPYYWAPFILVGQR